MSQQTWNFAAIMAGAADIHGSVGTTQSLLEEGEASLGRLASTWTGAAQESYQALQVRWNSTAAELNSALQNLAQTVDEAAQTMAQTETGVAGMFAG
ncbi:MAG: WXG100 family type VII secretion target [Mycolicibacterium cosmeticum]|nr:WXG100 family type VII secretion target [Mycolicibacterium cosmeticum]